MLENIGFTIEYDIKGIHMIVVSRLVYLRNEGCKQDN
jgi:hypothetical protein